MSDVIPIERIENKILLIREKKVLLDSDLAQLYGVETRIFNQAIRRNIQKFPDDFMFMLSREELTNLISQNVISSSKHGGIRRTPFAFTEHGAIMAATLLKSDKAVEVSVSVVRTFVKMREMLISNDKLAKKLEELEERIDQHDENSIVIMATLRKLIGRPKEPKKRRIGFQGREEQS